MLGQRFPKLFFMNRANIIVIRPLSSSVFGDLMNLGEYGIPRTIENQGRYSLPGSESQKIFRKTPTFVPKLCINHIHKK